MQHNLTRTWLIAIAVGAGLLLTSGRVLAHHGANLFDMSKATELKGTITEFRWGNPHNQISST